MCMIQICQSTIDAPLSIYTPFNLKSTRTCYFTKRLRLQSLPHTMADAAAIILSLPGLIDICDRLFHSLLTTLTTFRDPHSHSRLHQLILELTTGSLHDILLFCRDRTQVLHPTFTIHLYEATVVFIETLNKVKDVFSRAPHSVRGFGGGGAKGHGGRIKSILKRLRYSLWDARKLESACKELEKWQDRFVTRAQVYFAFAFLPICNPLGHAPRQELDYLGLLQQQQHLQRQQLQHQAQQHPGNLITE